MISPGVVGDADEDGDDGVDALVEEGHGRRAELEHVSGRKRNGTY